MDKVRRLRLLCGEPSADMVSDLLLGLGAIDVALEEGPRPGTVRVAADFTPGVDEDDIAVRVERHAAMLGRELGGTGVEGLSWEDVPAGAWEEWKARLRCVRAGERIIVCPPWDRWDAALGGRGRVVEVVINPSLAFGTGHHESTRLALALMERLIEQGRVRRMLDLGCGSGVLAIAARLLGVEEVWGVDVDDVAVREARLNARLNSVSRGLHLVHGTIGDVEGVFDMVVANIYVDPIVAMAPAIWERLRPGQGRLVVSGVTAERRDEAVCSVERNGFVLEEELKEGDWVGLVFAARARR